MEDATTVLLGLPGFRVLDVRRIDERGTRWVLVETIEPAAGCPACGVISDRVHERPAAPHQLISDTSQCRGAASPQLRARRSCLAPSSSKSP